MLTNRWNKFLTQISAGQFGRTYRQVHRRRDGWEQRTEALECRVLLSAAAVDVQAKTIGGSLFLTGLTAGSRSVTITQEAWAPGTYDVTAGAGTTINGSTATYHFVPSNSNASIFVTLNNGTGSGGSSQFAFYGSNSALSSMFVNLLGGGADSATVQGAHLSGSLYVTTGSGNDHVSLANTSVAGVTDLTTGLGHDTVGVQQGTFGGLFLVNGSVNGGDTLNVDDDTFNGPTELFLSHSGNTINIEQNVNLPGTTTFNSTTLFYYLGVSTRGGGGSINLGTPSPDSHVQFNGQAIFLAANVATATNNVNFGHVAPIFILCNRTTVSVPVSITTTTLPAWTQDQPGYSQTIATAGGIAALTFIVSDGSLPDGLTLNPNTGLISGTPTTAETSFFTIEVLDAGGPSAMQSYTLTINPPVSILNTTLSDATQNLPGYNQTIFAEGGTGPLTFSVSAGALPAGLTLDPNAGVISGTPTTLGTSTFTIEALDQTGAFATQQYTVTINGPVAITTTTLAAGTQNQANYSQTIATTGGTAPLTFFVTAGSLPDGLTLDPNAGVISGSPTTVGSSTFTIEALDQSGSFATHTYTVTINAALVITTTSLASSTQNQPGYSQTVVATGGTGSHTFSVSTGSLPTGLTLNANTGVISGTPTLVGTSTFTIQALDQAGGIATQLYTITINGSVAITTTSLAAGTQNQAGYSQTIATTGGTAPLMFSVSVGALPSGLTLNTSTGVISGTPTAVGTTTFTIEALDQSGQFATHQFTLTVNPPVAITTTSLSAGTQNQGGYSQTIATTGGTAPLMFSVSIGALPSGLTLNTSTGVISGTPTAVGTTTFTIEALDQTGAFATHQFSLTVNPPVAITTTSLSAGTQNQSGYSQTIAATGGTTPLTFSVSVGSLPAGLTLNPSTGVISGTPTSVGTATFTIEALDQNGEFATHVFTLTVNAPVAITTTSPLAASTQNQPGYSQTIATTGGTGPLMFSVSVGALPSGLTLNTSTGVISGTPNAVGTTTFTVEALDQTNAFATHLYTITINPPVAITTTSLAASTQNQPGYSQTVSTTGGTGPQMFSVSVGALPSGLTLNTSTGVISGTPNAVGTTTFTVEALDQVGAFTTHQYTVTINAPVAITTSSLAASTQNQPGYSQTIATTGGTGPDTFSVSVGSLPSGLSLNANTGVISGTPNLVGTTTFTIQATDQVGAFATHQYTLTINPPVAITTASLANGNVNVAYNQTVNTSGGTAPLQFSVSVGALPTGLNLNTSTGVISGSPTSVGSITFTIEALDSVGAFATHQYTVTISP